jgi:hypothetical protein
MINLYFGYPIDDWAKETVEIYAINLNVSMQKALFMVVDNMVKVTSERGDDNCSLIDSRFSMGFGLSVFAPEISVKQYSENEFLYPMMAVSQDFAIQRGTGDRLPITGEVLSIFGKEFEDSFGVEYLGHEWTGKRKWLNLKQIEIW